MTEQEIKQAGQWWHDPHTSVRIMTVCDGYVMARRPRQEPFVRSIADFTRAFKQGKFAKTHIK